MPDDRRPPTHDATLADLRARIDEINERLCRVLAERARLAAKIAAAKRALGRPIHDPEREREQLRAVRDLTLDGVESDTLARIFETVLEESRRAQQP